MYKHQHEVALSAQSADVVVPLLREIVGPIDSAVDFGGGTGVWLRRLLNSGTQRVLLLDVPDTRPHLEVPDASFMPTDLTAELPNVGRFDLAMSVECAEHLPASAAPRLVEALTSASDIVLFSAAVPGQSGTSHINEQPAAYWRELFAARGFVRRDLLRGRLVNNSKVAFWYRQNLFLYATPERAVTLPGNDFLPDDFLLFHLSPLKAMERRASRPTLSALARAIGPALSRSVRSKMNRFFSL